MKDFTTQEQSSALKELGFDEECKNVWENNNFLENAYSSKNSDLIPTAYSAPTYSQAFRWFRQKHNLRISFAYWNGYNDALPDYMQYKYECFVIPPNDGSITVRGKDNRVYFDIYEEAESACLDKLIEIVKRKKDEANNQ